jgi:hypothetical protein
MGLYLFVNQILAFLPPFLFSLLNETGFSMRWGLASLNVFFVFGLIFLSCLGNYQHAMDRAQNCSSDTAATGRGRLTSSNPLDDRGDPMTTVCLPVPG